MEASSQGWASDFTGEDVVVATGWWGSSLGCPGQSWSPIAGQAGSNSSEYTQAEVGRQICRGSRGTTAGLEHTEPRREGHKKVVTGPALSPKDCTF